MSNSGKDGVVVLGGREFKRVKNGVDEAEIGAFIDELITERDEMAKAKHHIASLTKLAETTIVEADRMAAQIKAEASEQAKAESAAVMEQAQEQGREMAEKKQAEALEKAHEEASAIVSQAEKQAAELLENAKTRVRDELRTIVNGQFGSLLEELESLKQRAAAAQAEFETKMSQPAEESSPGPAEPAEESPATNGKMDGETGAPTATPEEAAETAAVKEDKMPDTPAEETQDDDRSERDFDLSRLLQNEDWGSSSEPQFEVEILPPIHMTRIMEIVAHLDRLPEVENTEIIPRMDSPSILVFLRQEINLVDVLQSMPAVAYVEEVTADASSNNGESTKEPKKLRIGLSEKTTSQQTR